MTVTAKSSKNDEPVRPADRDAAVPAPAGPVAGSGIRMRFDVLLHELHLFRSRTAATEAIRGGAALLDGARVKPSHPVMAGARITLIRGGSRRTLEVLELPARPLSKAAARERVREIP